MSLDFQIFRNLFPGKTSISPEAVFSISVVRILGFIKGAVFESLFMKMRHTPGFSSAEGGCEAAYRLPIFGCDATVYRRRRLRLPIWDFKGRSSLSGPIADLHHLHRFKAPKAVNAWIILIR
jgi:hypothetical protein